MERSGVILAGGEGTRLRPLTLAVNKHLLPVYDRPMIDYQIDTLKAMGCERILVVTGAKDVEQFERYLGDDYQILSQDGYRSVPHALKTAEGKVEGLFPVLLGDCYFEEAPAMPDGPAIYTTPVPDPERFGVYQDGQIVEKPQNPKTNEAVTGLMVYDERVFDIIDELQPSARGEYEITDVNNYYLKLGAEVIKHSGYWADLGTFESLRQTANRIAEQR
jgi:glucose-1-phosphate thymidylyltransferase